MAGKDPRAGTHSGRKGGGKATTKQGSGGKEKAAKEKTERNITKNPAQQKPRGSNKKGQPGKA